MEQSVLPHPGLEHGLLVPVRLYRLIRAVAGDAGKFMARKSDPLSDSFGTDDSEGWLGGIVADEDDIDRRTMWRLGLWGFAAVGTLTLGILSSQLPVNAQRTQLAANELTIRARQVETSTQENRLEARRLAAAIETLNSDRDRLFSRLSNLEQGLDVVTGSITKATERPAVTAWPDAAIAPIVLSAPPTIPSSELQPAAATPMTALEAERAPTALALRNDELPAESVAATPPSAIQAAPIPDVLPVAHDARETPADEAAVAHADFGVDLGAANSIGGLRALWRGLIKSHRADLDGLRPLIAIHERRNGLGLQLRLIAGPIRDAAAAARICAVLSGAERDCKTSIFDGQRLSLAAEPEAKAAPSRRPKQRKSSREQQPDTAQAKPADSPSLATRLGFR